MKVFLSYDRADATRARPLALALEKAGHEVWWDQHIRGGAQFAQEIDRALKTADAIVVLWSRQSLESPWVRDEAAVGRDRGRLVPATLDGSDPPLGFRQYQTIDLSNWRGNRRSAAFDALLHAIATVESVTPGTGPPPRSGTRRDLPRVSTRALLLGLAALLAVAALFVAWQRFNSRGSIPVVAVVASDSTAGSRSVARDLLIKLGSLQAARADVFQLIEGKSGGRADLIFEASVAGGGPNAEASLALLGGRNRNLLWSKQFTQPDGKAAHLRQQLAVTAGQVLNCALDALNDKSAGIRPEVLKLYLNGCASFDDLAYGELRRMVPVMREVTRKAPRFAAAWGKLIQAEVLTTVVGSGDAGQLVQLRKDIAEARRVNPHLAEAYLAETELLPAHAYGQRLRLTELATRHNPRHPEPYAARAYYLRFVGRMAESVENAKHAADLNPLSPALQTDYIQALSHAGEFGRAKQVLARAEQLWAGSSVVAAARHGFHLRYGDPQIALDEDQPRSPVWTSRVVKAFLRARTAPAPANIDLAIDEARALVRQEPAAIAVLIQILAEFDRKDEVLSLLLDPKSRLDPQISDVLFRPTMSEVWRDRRFMLVAKRLRLLDYWRESGKWPDFCREPAIPYDCKEEAAKLAA